MNATFDLKRFLRLERYKGRETGKHLLWSAAIVSAICILCILYDLNRGGSYYGKYTSAGNLSLYVFWFLLAAPCLLETNLTRRTSSLYILLPASVFEKFLHVWLKYVLLIPMVCALMLICLKGIFLLSDNFYLRFFAEHIQYNEISRNQLLPIALLHASAFTGYFAFRRQVILKSFTVFVAVIAVCIGIVMIMVAIMPEHPLDNYWMNNIVTWPETNYPLSSTGRFIIHFCNYAAPACVLAGSWITSYFLLKEKQL